MNQRIDELMNSRYRHGLLQSSALLFLSTEYVHGPWVSSYKNSVTGKAQDKSVQQDRLRLVQLLMLQPSKYCGQNEN